MRLEIIKLGFLRSLSWLAGRLPTPSREHTPPISSDQDQDVTRGSKSATQEFSPDPEWDALLKEFSNRGGILDYVILRPESETEVQPHRTAALAGIAVIDRRWNSYIANHVTEEDPREKFFTYKWDETKLSGAPVSFTEFWGTDDVIPKPIDGLDWQAWSIPEIDGYKPAFFHGPHGLWGSYPENEVLFAKINAFVLGPNPTTCEIYSWSTDWSNYFDAGKEWWGTFYWTVRRADSGWITVIGASTTD